MADQRIGKRYKTARMTGNVTTNLDELYSRFYNAKIAEGIADGTLEQYNYNYTYFTAWLDANNVERDVNNVTTDLVREYAAWMLKTKVRFDGHKYKPDSAKTTGLTPVTVNTRLKTLRTMFTFLASEGVIDDNPMLNVKKVEEYEKEIIIMSDDQLKQLLRTPNQRTYAGFRDYVMMNALLDGFFRISEALRIRTGDIDFDAGIVTIRGKEAKSRRFRFVPLSQPTLKLLRELIEENADFDTDYVFVANHGGPLTDDQFRNRLKTYVQDVGIRIRVHPHLFRHTAATLFLENGGDIRHLQMIMGHAELRMLERYTHLSSKALKRQHEQYTPLNNVLNSLNKPRKRMR